MTAHTRVRAERPCRIQGDYTTSAPPRFQNLAQHGAVTPHFTFAITAYRTAMSFQVPATVPMLSKYSPELGGVSIGRQVQVP